MSQLITASVPSWEEAVKLEHQKIAESETAISVPRDTGWQTCTWHQFWRVTKVIYSNGKKSHTVFYPTDITKSALERYPSSGPVTHEAFPKYSALCIYVLWHSWGSRLAFSTFYWGFQAVIFDCFFCSFSIENWTTRPISVCTSSLSAKHLEPFHLGWSTLHSREGHASKNNQEIPRNFVLIF